MVRYTERDNITKPTLREKPIRSSSRKRRRRDEIRMKRKRKPAAEQQSSPLHEQEKEEKKEKTERHRNNNRNKEVKDDDDSSQFTMNSGAALGRQDEEIARQTRGRGLKKGLALKGKNAKRMRSAVEVAEATGSVLERTGRVLASDFCRLHAGNDHEHESKVGVKRCLEAPCTRPRVLEQITGPHVFYGFLFFFFCLHLVSANWVRAKGIGGLCWDGGFP